ncbi:hypothetical protein ACFE04_027067 [Oxalis oulophora]
MATATLYVFINCDDVKPYIDRYKELVHLCRPDLTNHEVEQSFEDNFAEWFKEYVMDDRNNIQDRSLKDLAYGPSNKYVEVNHGELHEFQHREDEEEQENVEEEGDEDNNHVTEEDDYVTNEEHDTGTK